MNPVHIHLMLNHVPLVGLGFGMLLMLAALLKKNTSLARATLAIWLIGAAVAIPVYLTGEPAEESVEKLAGVSETLIEAHEESAEASFAAIEILGAIALAGLLVRSPRFSGKLIGLACVAALAAGILMARTANLGGQIRHSEIRHTSPLTDPAQKQIAPTSEDMED